MVTLTMDDNPAVLQSLDRILARVDPDGTHLSASAGTEALELIRGSAPDVAFLDIEMPDSSGLEVARRLKSLRPLTNLVFITGHSEYAVSAFGLYASAYLLKPITEAQIRSALANLRHPLDTSKSDEVNRLRVQCFGSFEVWHGGTPVRFSRSRTKMLLAYLIDRNGAMCDTGQMICALWPEAEHSASYSGQLRVFLSDLQTTLTRLGLGEVLVRSRGTVGINKAMVDCDYYAYLEGSPAAMHRFNGEYMSQYPFGEVTLASLTGNREKLISE